MIGDLMLIKLAFYERWRGSEGRARTRSLGGQEEWAAYRVSAEGRDPSEIHEARMRERSRSQDKSQRGGDVTRAPFLPRDKHAHAQKVNNGAGTRVA